MYEIYKITIVAENKIYIGVTTQGVKVRADHHFQKKNSIIGEAMRLHGKLGYTVETIETHDDKGKAYYREEVLIREHKSHLPEFGYNTNIGNKATGKLLEKRMKNLDDYRKTDEFIERVKAMGYARKGKKASEETLKKLSESHKGQVAWNKGKKLSEEHRLKLSLAKQGKVLTEEHKQKIKEAHLKRSNES